MGVICVFILNIIQQEMKAIVYRIKSQRRRRRKLIFWFFCKPVIILVLLFVFVCIVCSFSRNNDYPEML